MRTWNMTVIIIVQLASCLFLLIAPDFCKAIEQQQQRIQTNTNNLKLINSKNSNNNQRIDWSNLGAVNLTSELPELSTDWLMLGGSADNPESRDKISRLSNSESDLMVANEAKSSVSFASASSEGNRRKSSNRSASSGKSSRARKNKAKANATTIVLDQFDDEQIPDESESNEIFDDIEEIKLAGTQKEPECASHGRYYCTYKEDYPTKLVTEVTKYYKWPLEKLFRDLHAQIMPKLAQDSNGNLVCDSITRVVRPGWARNTNDRWLVVINTDNYHQYVTEVVCQYGSNSRCNFIPPCYYSSCQQRYNTQKLLVIDPTNPYRGPFLSEFLFPSCCVCYVPKTSDALNDQYRASPASIYQRTMQQDSSMNLNPMGSYNNLIDLNANSNPAPSSANQASSSSSSQQTNDQNDPQASNFMEPNTIQAQQQANGPKSNQPSATVIPTGLGGSNQPLGPGEIRRSGELMPHKHSIGDNKNNYHSALVARAGPRSLSSFPSMSMEASSNIVPSGEPDDLQRNSKN